MKIGIYVKTINYYMTIKQQLVDYIYIYKIKFKIFYYVKSIENSISLVYNILNDYLVGKCIYIKLIYRNKSVL